MTRIVATADLLNDRVLSFYASQDLLILRILTEGGIEYCGKVEQHDYQLCLAINDIDHTKTKAMSPQTNGICDAVPHDDIAGIITGDVPQKAVW